MKVHREYLPQKKSSSLKFPLLYVTRFLLVQPASINPLLSLDSILIMPLPGLCIYIADDNGVHKNGREVGI